MAWLNLHETPYVFSCKVNILQEIVCFSNIKSVSDCKHIYIPHCKPGRQWCGGSPDNIKCTECEKYYVSGGYGNGCSKYPFTRDHVK